MYAQSVQENKNSFGPENNLESKTIPTHIFNISILTNLTTVSSRSKDQLVD